MKLGAAWMDHPGTRAIFDMVEEAGFRAWFVGGCVRNGLLGAPVGDIDLTTDAPPDRVMDLAEASGIRAIPTGIAHGTVTLVAGRKPHEITTLRRDVETDGRHARVAFSNRLEDDAARRDFTMNALYATRDGDVLDPNGAGVADLHARHLRFIGDPDARIAEDYLRILRFFRFHAWYADPAGGIDPDGLAACAAGLGGLATLPGERIGAEMLKLLAAPDPAPAVASMGQTGILSAILPGANPAALTSLTAHDGSIPPDPIRRLAALGGEEVPERLRLSKADAARLELYHQEAFTAADPAALGYRHGARKAEDILALHTALLQGRAPHQDEIAAINLGAEAVFPISAADLMPALSGPALGAKLQELEARWIESRFTLSKTDLL